MALILSQRYTTDCGEVILGPHCCKWENKTEMFLNTWNSFFSEMGFLSGNNNKPKTFFEYPEHPKNQPCLFLPSARSLVGRATPASHRDRE